MRRTILRPAIGLYFDDHSRNALSIGSWNYQELAEKIARNLQYIRATVEFTREFAFATQFRIHTRKFQRTGSSVRNLH
jgi:hypothetical protein